MFLTYHGGATFKVSGQKDKESFSILINPFSAKGLGLRGPNIGGNILIFNDEDERKTVEKNKERESLIISGPGEYEKNGIFVYGFSCNRKTIYSLTVDGIIIVYLNDSDEVLTENIRENFDKVDILLIPIGGNTVLNAARAWEEVEELEPRVVIPYFYALNGIKEKYDPIEPFAKKFGVKTIEFQDKFILSEKELPQGEDMKFVALKAE
ncbi:MAG: MBL fold metallo-hydrolase [Parcubacteria group bacterium]|nr:MBL fold metallo-hydrolase [Parcubacteria group bacterium]